MAQRSITVTGSAIRTRYGPEDEVHEFATAAEADARGRVFEEAMTWIGTPFRNCADIKGPGGGIDCAMLLVRSFVGAGWVAPFDPRPYPPDWFMHRSEEKFLEWIEEKFGGRRIEDHRIGDVMIWHYGRCFSHAGIVINRTEVVHAFAVAGLCLISRMREEPLDLLPVASGWKRPRLTFDVWK